MATQLTASGRRTPLPGGVEAGGFARERNVARGPSAVPKATARGLPGDHATSSSGRVPRTLPVSLVVPPARTSSPRAADCPAQRTPQSTHDFLLAEVALDRGQQRRGQPVASAGLAVLASPESSGSAREPSNPAAWPSTAASFRARACSPCRKAIPGASSSVSPPKAGCASSRIDPSVPSSSERHSSWGSVRRLRPWTAPAGQDELGLVPEALGHGGLDALRVLEVAEKLERAQRGVEP